MKFATLQRIILPPTISADEFIALHGANAAAKLDDHTVRLLRPFKLVPLSEAEAAEWNRPRAGAAPFPFPFLGAALPRAGAGAFILIFFLVFGAATGWGAGVGARPVDDDAARAALPLLAEVTPGDAHLWITIVVGCLAVIAFFRPQPALHKQFAGREDHDKDIKEIKESLRDMKGDFENWSKAHYEARRRMHRKINHMTSALAYFAGSMEKSEPQTAARMRALIDKVDEEGDDE